MAVKRMTAPGRNFFYRHRRRCAASQYVAPAGVLVVVLELRPRGVGELREGGSAGQADEEQGAEDRTHTGGTYSKGVSSASRKISPFGAWCPVRPYDSVQSARAKRLVRTTSAKVPTR